VSAAPSNRQDASLARVAGNRSKMQERG